MDSNLAFGGGGGLILDPSRLQFSDWLFSHIYQPMGQLECTFLEKQKRPSVRTSPGFVGRVGRCLLPV